MNENFKGVGGIFTKKLSSKSNVLSGIRNWKGDTVELVRGQSYLVTLVERKTQFLATKHISNKKSETVRNAILSAFELFPQTINPLHLTMVPNSPTIKPSLIARMQRCVLRIRTALGNIAFGEKSSCSFHKWSTAINSLKATPCSVF